MSPTQVTLAQQFGDVVINDIAMQRNKYGLPLNLWVIVDQFFVTQNIAYALHDGETADDHAWALDCLLGVLPLLPSRVLLSDYDTGLEAAIKKYPGIWHGRCLHHLEGNFTKKLALILSPLYQSFREEFWTVYHAISPVAFEHAWARLIEHYPAVGPYLQGEPWMTRERWAWTYVATRFTCGVRTSGRVEGENAVNRLLGDSKTSLYDLVLNLIARAAAQGDMEVLRICQVSSTSRFFSSFLVLIMMQATWLRHPTQTDTLFELPLKLLRDHCMPYAVQKSYDEMENSVFYMAERVNLRDGTSLV